MCAALVLALPMQRTVEECTFGLAVVGSSVVQLLAAVRAEYQTGKHTGSAGLGLAVTLLADLLNLFKHIFCNDGFMGIIKDCLIFNRIVPLFFIPDGIGVSLEIDNAPGVLSAFQNMNHGATVPSARIFRYSIGAVPALAFLIRRWGQNLLFSQHIGNLRRASSLHAQLKDIFHNLGCFRVNDPVLRILWVFHITVRDIGSQRNTTLTLCLIDSTDFSTGITGVKLIEPVLDACKIVVHAVRVRGVKVIIDGNEADTLLRKGKVGVQSGQCRVSAKSGKVFAENSGNPTGLHFRQHTLKAGAVIIRTTVTVIHKEYRIGKVVFLGILQENGFLIFDGQGLTKSLVLLR